MVPCVGIKSLYPVLSVLNQTNGQVLVGQSDVIRKVVYSWVSTDEFPRLWVVVATLIKQDFVEFDRCMLSGVATGDAYRESEFGNQTFNLQMPGSPGGPRWPLSPFSPRRPGGPGGPKFPGSPSGPRFPMKPLSPRSPSFPVGPTLPLRPEDAVDFKPKSFQTTSLLHWTSLK